MIYLLYGKDTAKSRNKLHELVASMLKKKPDAAHMRVTEETFNEAQLDELIGGMGLFASKAIVESDNVFKNKDAKEIIVKRIKEIAESENVFVFLEGDLDKKTLEKFEKYAAKVQEFAINETKSRQFMTDTGVVFALKDFNIFSLTDALGRRDKKSLWVMFTKAKMKEISAEEIHGLFAWQVRAMLQASRAKSADAAGLKPFVYQKSLGFLRNFKDGEVQGISSKLVSIYHDARRGIHDFDAALEKFILEL